MPAPLKVSRPTRSPSVSPPGSACPLPTGHLSDGPDWPQPILPPNSVSLLHLPSPNSLPRRSRSGAAEGKTPGVWNGSRPARPATPPRQAVKPPPRPMPREPSEAPNRAGAQRPGPWTPGPTHRELAERGSWRAPGPEERDAAPARVPTSEPGSARRAGRSLQPPPPRVLLHRHLGRHLDQPLSLPLSPSGRG